MMRAFIYLIGFLFCANTVISQNVTGVSELIPIDCNGGVSTWLVSTDATGPFSYLLQNEYPAGVWNDVGGITPVPLPPNFLLTNVFASTFRIILYDASGTPVDTSSSWVVTQPPPLMNLFTNVTNVTCTGYNDGTATVNPS